MNSYRHKTRRVLCLLLATLIVFPPHVMAQLGNGLTVDVKALALGNAVQADISPSVSAVYHNPAGLTRLKERHFEMEDL